MKLLVVFFAGIHLLLTADVTVRAEEVIARPEWSIGDWWESNDIRQTVVGAKGDRYEIVRTRAGAMANPDAGSKQRQYMTLDGWVAESVDRDGKTTEFTEDSRYEWVRFPLSAGKRWSFAILGRGRTMGASQRYEHDCAASKWEEIELSKSRVRALRIECKSWIRDSPSSGWFHTAWYAPEAKRVVRVTSHYVNGPTLEISAWGVRP